MHRKCLGYIFFKILRMGVFGTVIGIRYIAGKGRRCLYVQGKYLFTITWSRRRFAYLNKPGVLERNWHGGGKCRRWGRSSPWDLRVGFREEIPPLLSILSPLILWFGSTKCHSWGSRGRSKRAVFCLGALCKMTLFITVNFYNSCYNHKPKINTIAVENLWIDFMSDISSLLCKNSQWKNEF